MPPIQYFLGSLGITSILGLSAYGSCIGMAVCGGSAILYSNIPFIITYSYISMIMISMGFFYGFLISIIIINKIDKNYTMLNSVRHLSGGILFGTVALFSGIIMGKMTRFGFRHLVKRPQFFTGFLLSLAFLEVILVIAFLCTLTIVFKS